MNTNSIFAFGREGRRRKAHLRRLLFHCTPTDVYFVAVVAFLAGGVLGLQLALT